MKYALVLNDMRSPNVENVATVPGSPISTDRKVVVDWYKEQLAEDSWRDGQWGKIFKKDSLLEWFNGGNLEEDNYYWGGIYTFYDDVPDEVIRSFCLFK